MTMLDSELLGVQPRDSKIGFEIGCQVLRTLQYSLDSKESYWHHNNLSFHQVEAILHAMWSLVTYKSMM
jgi:hypothetical protein